MFVFDNWYVCPTCLFCLFLHSGKADYTEPAKRAHIMAQPRGRGRGMFNQQGCRPHDIFRQRKQNTSRPPSMHVDDFLAAEFKDVGPAGPGGLIMPKRPPKGGAKPPTRGLFTAGAAGGARTGWPTCPATGWRDSRRGGKCEKVKSLPLLTVVQEGRSTGLPYLNGWVRIPPPLWRGPITF